jgi:hypothetical protein
MIRIHRDLSPDAVDEADGGYLSGDEDLPAKPEETLVSEALLLMSGQLAPAAPSGGAPSASTTPARPAPRSDVACASDAARELAERLVAGRQRAIPPHLLMPLPDEAEPEFFSPFRFGAAQPSAPCPQQAAAPFRGQLPPLPAQALACRPWQQTMLSPTEWAPAPPPQWALHRAVPVLALACAGADASGAGGAPDDDDRHHDDAAAQWSAAEDQITTEAVSRFGCKWNLISALVPGRTAASVRNRWHRIRRAARMRDSDAASAAGEGADGMTSSGAAYKCSRVRACARARRRLVEAPPPASARSGPSSRVRGRRPRSPSAPRRSVRPAQEGPRLHTRAGRRGADHDRAAGDEHDRVRARHRARRASAARGVSAATSWRRDSARGRRVWRARAVGCGPRVVRTPRLRCSRAPIVCQKPSNSVVRPPQVCDAVGRTLEHASLDGAAPDSRGSESVMPSTALGHSVSLPAGGQAPV